MPRQPKLPPGMTKRGTVYFSAFRAGGRLVRKRLSTDLSAAKEMLNDLKARADRADFGLLDNDLPLAEIRKSYTRHCEQSLRPRTAKRYASNIANVLSRITARKVSQLSVEVVMEFRRDRLIGEAGVSPRTVNMDVGAVSTMLNWAVDHRLIGSNPLASLKPLPADNPTKERRSLTIEEVDRLFVNSPEHLRPVWRMFMTTGMRLGELAGMRFADVDFDRGTVTVRAATAKNHRSREIPLDDEMLATIRRLRAEAPLRQPGRGNTEKITERIAERFSREHVFVTKAGTPWHGRLLDRFYAICKRAQIDGAEFGGNVDIHSLRVSFATLTLEHGANPKDVQAILGHSTLAMTMSVYTKATERGKRAAVSALPFAKVSAPSGIVALQNVPKVCASTETSLQVVAG